MTLFHKNISGKKIYYSIILDIFNYFEEQKFHKNFETILTGF